MPDAAWYTSPTVWGWIGFHVFIVLMMILDLGVFQRRAHVVRFRGAAGWYALWVSFAAAFASGIWFLDDSESALQFTTGYLIEVSLSVDNLFVFMVIFRYFAVPPEFQRRGLMWGIILAMILRAVFILAGAALLAAFHWLLYGFGVLLLYTAYKLARAKDEEVDPSRNLALRLARRVIPMVGDYDSPGLFIRRDGRWYGTPMFLVLLVIGTTDVMFALDSIPAIFAVTRDAFIVYTSNIFAVLGLRSLYFLVARLLGAFRYLNTGLALVLAFVGIKMLIEEPLKPRLEAWGLEEMHVILISLGVIVAILGVSILASLLAGPEKERAPASAKRAEQGEADPPVLPPPADAPTPG